MATSSVGQARFALLIHGPSLDMEALSAQLGLPATHCSRKGELLNRLPRIEAAEDLWCHEIPLTAPEGTDAELNALLSQIVAHREDLTAIAQTCRVGLRLYIQSDRAQIAYRLMPETLQRLVDTGLPLDMTSLSWGEIGI